MLDLLDSTHFLKALSVNVPIDLRHDRNEYLLRALSRGVLVEQG